MARSGRPLKVESELVGLYQHVAGEDLEHIDYLIAEYGINSHDEYKRSLLIHCCIENKIKILERLISEGADINFQDIAGYSGLHFAASGQHIAIAKRLIASGANVNAVDEHGNPPIWTALFNSKDNFALIKLLVNSGADIEIVNKHKRSTKELAISMHGEEFLNKFLND